MEEILNIHFHTVKLILKSLNSSRTISEAASKCGVTKRTFYRLKRDNNIEYIKEKKMYMVTKWYLSDKLDLLNDK